MLPLKRLGHDLPQDIDALGLIGDHGLFYVLSREGVEFMLAVPCGTLTLDSLATGPNAIVFSEAVVGIESGETLGRVLEARGVKCRSQLALRFPDGWTLVDDPNAAPSRNVVVDHAVVDSLGLNVLAVDETSPVVILNPDWLSAAVAIGRARIKVSSSVYSAPNGQAIMQSATELCDVLWLASRTIGPVTDQLIEAAEDKIFRVRRAPSQSYEGWFWVVFRDGELLQLPLQAGDPVTLEIPLSDGPTIIACAGWMIQAGGVLLKLELQDRSFAFFYPAVAHWYQWTLGVARRNSTPLSPRGCDGKPLLDLDFAGLRAFVAESFMDETLSVTDIPEQYRNDPRILAVCGGVIPRRRKRPLGSYKREVSDALSLINARMHEFVKAQGDIGKGTDYDIASAKGDRFQLGVEATIRELFNEGVFERLSKRKDGETPEQHKERTVAALKLAWYRHGMNIFLPGGRLLVKPDQAD